MVRRIVLFVLIIIALALLTISFRSPTSGALHDMQGYGATALRPFQVAAERVARPFRDVYGYFNGLASAKSENKKLRRELRDSRAKAASNAGASQTLAAVEKLLHFEQGPTYPNNYRPVNTSVISYPGGPFAQQMTIAAGSSLGIHANTPIVTADGLVGRVSNVTPDTSQVTLLTDPDSSIPARDVSHKNGTVTGLIQHGPGNTLIFNLVPKAVKLHVGDFIVTEGTVDRRYPDFYPAGILIGTVLSVNASDVASYLTVQVLPSAQLGSLDAVAALIPNKQR
jgi:rod shape-determining protein MreC